MSNAGYQGLYQAGYRAPALSTSLRPLFSFCAAQRLAAPIVPLGTCTGTALAWYVEHQASESYSSLTACAGPGVGRRAEDVMHRLRAAR